MSCRFVASASAAMTAAGESLSLAATGRFSLVRSPPATPPCRSYSFPGTGVAWERRVICCECVEEGHNRHSRMRQVPLPLMNPGSVDGLSGYVSDDLPYVYVPRRLGG